MVGWGLKGGRERRGLRRVWNDRNWKKLGKGWGVEGRMGVFALLSSVNWLEDGLEECCAGMVFMVSLAVSSILSGIYFARFFHSFGVKLRNCHHLVLRFFITTTWYWKTWKKEQRLRMSSFAIVWNHTVAWKPEDGSLLVFVCVAQYALCCLCVLFTASSWMLFV